MALIKIVQRSSKQAPIAWVPSDTWIHSSTWMPGPHDFEDVGSPLRPGKLTAGNLKITRLTREIIFQTFIFVGSMLIFSGVNHFVFEAFLRQGSPQWNQKGMSVLQFRATQSLENEVEAYGGREWNEQINRKGSWHLASKIPRNLIHRTHWTDPLNLSI